VTTPGTAEWLREMAETQKVGFAEGLIRAANRIERLEGELSKQKTGVDQTHRPPILPRIRRAQSPQSLPGEFYVRLPDGDDEVYDRVFEWLTAFSNSEDDDLDPCCLFVGEDPCGEKTPGVLQLIDIEVGQGMNGEVAILGPKKMVVLVGCVFQSEVQDDNHITIKLTAKEVRDA